MSYTAFYLGQKYLGYGFGEGHPFTPERHLRTVELLKRRGIWSREDLRTLEAPVADDGLILLFHTEEYLEKVKEKSETGEGYLDSGDTPARKGIFEAGALVVGATVDGLHRVVNGEVTSSFHTVGGLHHARPNTAGGFCVFNDVGVGMRYLLSEGLVDKALYVDIDAHHGDGVFYSFEDEPRLLSIDVHQDGRTLYPGTGFPTETGSDEAVGTKVNVALSPGAGDEELLAAIERGFRELPVSEVDVVLLQAGADGLAGDPLTSLVYSLDGYSEAVTKTRRLAERVCDGNLVVFGGGGYDVEHTSEAWCVIVDHLTSPQTQTS